MAPWKNYLLAAAILGIFALVVMLSTPDPARQPSIPIPEADSTATKELETEVTADPRKLLIESQFVGGQGSPHRPLRELVKSAMHNPRSFEHVLTFYRDRGEYIEVTMRYRGKNAFGAVVVNEISAQYTIDGRLVKILD